MRLYNTIFSTYISPLPSPVKDTVPLGNLQGEKSWTPGNPGSAKVAGHIYPRSDEKKDF